MGRNVHRDQKRLDPSLSTTTTGKLHGDRDLRMIPASNISSTALSITALLFNGVLYGFILIGGCSPVSNFIFTVSVCRGGDSSMVRAPDS